ncbi:glycerophosphodiester phosphodiesterase [Streptomyces catenulae]|uniref:Glycerophosphodiester phosphodiesterase family protein n=1 Tax=Streptomyces catenulae TaxID=66875 RepID=A0ABV2Z759_9ACTN|nr:glycerophosphodiester phosphodiesterase family protein [Streptomyces catenulae]
MRLRTAATALSGALLGLSTLVLPPATAQAATGGHRTVAVAHRGAPTHAPENTVASINEAHRRGSTWVENDVQRTKDGQLIVMHDTTLNRTTDVKKVFPDRAPWKVADFTLNEIKKLDAGSWFDAKFTGERVPTLKQYMTAVTHNHQRLLLELKSPELYPGIELQVLSQLRRQGWLDRDHVKNRLIIQSFNGDAVKTVHLLRPDIKTGFLGNPTVAELPEYARFCDQINPSYTVTTPEYIKAVHGLRGPHGRPMDVYTWTVDNTATAVKLAGAGADGVISNSADTIRAALRKNGL